ncbi:MAG: hypothetical protein OXB96_01965 [Candidatus Kaiserbacteria bacterium]|nr:hypothetical protein [Candidatus Kaiserbacteria bacterium]
MSTVSERPLFLQYRMIYFFERLRGKSATVAMAKARGNAMQKMRKAVDARTQALAQQICAN